MDSPYVDDLIDDDEVPELTEEDFAKMTPFSGLSAGLQAKLNEIQSGNVTFRLEKDKRPVSIVLSVDVIERLEAQDAHWQDRMDDMLRQWLNDHPQLLEHAKAS